MNNYMCVGRITKDIELKYTTSNKAVIRVMLAVNNGKDDTTFLPITVFGNMAETTHKYCKKGDLMGVYATIKNQNWEDKNGNKHYDYSFIANKISFLSSKAKEIKEEAKKEETKDPFQEFGDMIEVNDNFLD